MRADLLERKKTLFLPPPHGQIPEYAPESEHEKIFFTFFSGNDVVPQRSTTVVFSVVL